MTLIATQPLRVYADTSVYGGVFDDEFSVPSRRFFQKVRDGRFSLVISALVKDELEQAPVEVRAWFNDYRMTAETVLVSAEAVALRQAYLEAGIVTPKSIDDALHVALATVAGCALIVSWNFRHIVHFEKVPLYNAVNVLHRRASLEIRSPLEVIEDED
jgi:predicted nucleic acid-binding protein